MSVAEKTDARQDNCPMMAEPAKEHQWLQRLIGEWTFEGECMMGPDQPPMKSSGHGSIRSLGGLKRFMF